MHTRAYSHHVTLVSMATAGGHFISVSLQENMAVNSITVPVVDDVVLRINEGFGVKGSLCISPCHIQFVSLRTDIEDLRFLVTDVADVDSKSGQAAGDIILKLKDFRLLHLTISPTTLCQDVVESIITLSLPDRLKSLPCFTYQAFGYQRGCCPPLEDLRDTMLRWSCGGWQITSINSKYKVCPTYPSQLIVHDTASDELLLKVAKFRYLSRFPVLCYYQSKTQTPLLRSSQPMMGSTQKRSSEDLQLLNACLTYGIKGTVVDTRTQGVAQLQMMKGGGGVEMMENYPRWKVQFAALDSYQQMQTSLNKLVELSRSPAMSSSNSWFSKVNETGWLSNIQLLLTTATAIARTINKGNPVLVHGDTGCDTELQLTSLVQIIMDPYCRTLKGFIELIEREWLSAGHPFSLRHRHCSSAPAKESGPVFLGFLDAVHQLQHQFPTSFEFSEALLHLLFTNSYSSEYGTFVYDCQRERLVNELPDKTCSLWNYIFSEPVKPSLCSPLYESNKHQLLPSKQPRDMVLWTRMFVRNSILQDHLYSPLREGLLHLKAKKVAARQHIAELYREIESASAALATHQQSLRNHVQTVDSDEAGVDTDLNQRDQQQCSDDGKQNPKNESGERDADGDPVHKVQSDGEDYNSDTKLPLHSCLDSHKLSPDLEEDSGTAALQPSEDADTAETLHT